MHYKRITFSNETTKYLFDFLKTVINLVCTRLSQQGTGDHRLLERWYSDHIHLLHACPELEAAQLFRCITPSIGRAPDYACIYEFADWPAFTSFENSPAKLHATELTQAASGRKEIEIVQRMQYQCVLERCYGRASSQAQSQWLFCCSIKETERSASCRWLCDAFYERFNALSGACIKAYMRPLDALENNLILHLELPAHASETNIRAPFDLIDRLLAHPSPYAPSPKALQLDWAAQLQPLITSLA